MSELLLLHPFGRRLQGVFKEPVPEHASPLECESLCGNVCGGVCK